VGRQPEPPHLAGRKKADPLGMGKVLLGAPTVNGRPYNCLMPKLRLGSEEISHPFVYRSPSLTAAYSVLS
jgi:hypothetical protein